MNREEEQSAFLIEYWNSENIWEKSHKKKETSYGKEHSFRKIYGKLISIEDEEAEYLREDDMDDSMERQNDGLKRRTIISLVILLFLVPVTIIFGVTYMENRKYLFISIMLLIYAMCPFFMIFEGRKPKARELSVIAVLSALTVSSRAAFFMLPSFKPLAAMVIISAVTLGPESGFLVACISILVSNFMFGQGPWTPWQMFAYGIIGFLAGVVFKEGRVKKTRTALCIYGFLSVIFIFGGIMNPASLIMYSAGITKKSLLAVYISGISMDMIQALSTTIFLWIGSGPMIEKIQRIKKKYGLLN